MPRVPVATSEVLRIGIDPGAQGGIASVLGDMVQLNKMPETEADIWSIVRGLGDFPGHKFAVVEKVGGYVPKFRINKKTGQAESGQPGSTMFTFGHNYGNLRMALIAAGIPFLDLVPQRWQKMTGVGSKGGLSKSEWKNRLKAKAQQLFPGVHVILDVSDALLMAWCCMRIAPRPMTAAAASAPDWSEVW